MSDHEKTRWEDGSGQLSSTAVQLCTLLFGSLFGGDFFFFTRVIMSDRMREVQPLDMIVCLSSAMIPQSL